MASGRTVGSNTITSVLAGRANTATVSVNSPASLPASTPTTPTNQGGALSVAKSPLEMVQSVVSSIQVRNSINRSWFSTLIRSLYAFWNTFPYRAIFRVLIVFYSFFIILKTMKLNNPFYHLHRQIQTTAFDTCFLLLRIISVCKVNKPEVSILRFLPFFTTFNLRSRCRTHSNRYPWPNHRWSSTPARKASLLGTSSCPRAARSSWPTPATPIPAWCRRRPRRSWPTKAPCRPSPSRPWSPTWPPPSLK